MTREYVQVYCRGDHADAYVRNNPVWHLTNPEGLRLLCSIYTGSSVTGMEVHRVQAFNMYPEPMCPTCRRLANENMLIGEDGHAGRGRLSH